MTMSLLNLMISDGSQAYYSEEIHLLLESHLDYLKKHPNTGEFSVLPNIAYKYEGDFYGLMLTLNVPMAYHWIMLRMNGFTSPNQMPGDKVNFIQPSFSIVEQIINSHKTANSLPV